MFLQLWKILGVFKKTFKFLVSTANKQARATTVNFWFNNVAY